MTADPLAPAAERTLGLIELLLARPEGWTPQELLLQLDLSRSSLFVLLRTLKALGYVEQAGKRGRYVIGPRLQAWRAPVSPSAQDILTAFYQEVEAALAGQPATETLALVLPAASREARSQDEGFLILAQVEGSQQVRSVFATDQRHSQMPAAGQVLQLFPNDKVRLNGYALVQAGDTLELALPICRDGYRADAALLLSAPAFRWTAQRLLAEHLDGLRQMAAHLSYRLGAPHYSPYRPSWSNEVIQPAAALKPEEISQFLEGPWAASLACIRPDGRPHVIPVWQAWDGEEFFVLAWKGSQWGDYLRANSNVSLTIDEPWSPLRRVVVQGSASLYQPDPTTLQRLLGHMVYRYLGRQMTEDLASQVEYAFRIKPELLRGWRGLTVENRPRKEAAQ